MATAIEVFTSCADITEFCRSEKANGKVLGVVPTMGALHEGHLSLVEAANKQCDRTIATIFVNPTQFAEGEDLSKYPRPFEADLEKLARLGVDTVFSPEEDEMYPDGYSVTLTPPEVGNSLEGEFRPTHFDGVATVVLKLINLTLADKAFFGQKDYQQALVIKHVVRDLNVPTEIVVCPIVREPDGLAMSSRNIYLSDEERMRALALSKTLDHVRQQIESGDRDIHALMSEMRQMLIDEGVDSIDYAALADPDTLQIHDEVHLPVVALIAAHIGNTRLIDNVVIK